MANNPLETTVCSEFQTMPEPGAFSGISPKLPGAPGVVGEASAVSGPVEGLPGGTGPGFLLAGFARAARSSSSKTDTVVF